MDVDTRGILVGFLGGAAVLAVLVYVVGLDDVLDAFALLQTEYVVLIVLAGLSWLVAWGFALRSVLGALGVDLSPARAVLLYSTAAFANNVTPFGQAGGEPFSALLISRATGSEYERSLAAIASVDSLNFVPSILLALASLLYFLTEVAVNGDLVTIVLVVAGLATAVPTAAFLVWRNRRRVQGVVAGVVTPLTEILGRVVPRFEPPERAVVKRRVGDFFVAIERVGNSPREILVALSFSAAGWVAMCGALWLALFALGHTVPVTAVFIAVPVGSIAGMTPLPGGLGGIEFALVLLLVPTTGVPAATAATAAIIFRGATYWLSTLVGGGALALLSSMDTP